MTAPSRALVAAAIDGTLDEAGARALLERLDAEPALRDELEEQWAMHALLGAGLADHADLERRLLRSLTVDARLASGRYARHLADAVPAPGRSRGRGRRLHVVVVAQTLVAASLIVALAPLWWRAVVDEPASQPAAAGGGGALVDDFSDHAAGAARWERFGDFPVARRDGALVIDCIRLDEDAYAGGIEELRGEWSRPGGVRSRDGFALPLRIELDVVGMSAPHENVVLMLGLLPADGADGDGCWVLRRRSDRPVLQILPLDDAAPRLAQRYHAAGWPGRERWVVTVDRHAITVAIDGSEVLRHRLALDATRPYRIALGARSRDTRAETSIACDRIAVTSP
ncbi:MAG TPA: hypothetical protein VEL07_16775 [Planctomycetota bacterium]|nr:hypothetical protein [Planctomycetota bacterium]